ncbi:hypothetical protein ATPR_3489 [Acetobacter tropicalis NBRC 101654]|uniref:Uncharacterized protein n=1 Tax=Acetobacter tropicalis NBRC 101654 TaxID=749388 RepID=F7VJE0_9PROT|nr:hypothetical protein ATPR_3489 [Acetobacter tropicalis NBRC 101654]
MACKFLVGKDMLDAGSDHGLSSIRPLDMGWHGLEVRLLPVNI